MSGRIEQAFVWRQIYGDADVSVFPARQANDRGHLLNIEPSFPDAPVLAGCWNGSDLEIPRSWAALPIWLLRLKLRVEDDWKRFCCLV